MAKKQDGPGFQEIMNDIRAKRFKPVYLFHGEESYYIDQLTDCLIENALDDSERDFNQTIFYGLDRIIKEEGVAPVINACRRFPMMAERQLVILKEAQSVKTIDDLVHYVNSPVPTTLLVINYKYGTLDGRKKLGKEIAKKGVLFESAKLRDYQIPAFITNYLKEKRIAIDAKATQLLADYLGDDLSKIVNELDKLGILLPADNRKITPEIIEKNIGISKDFNNFELQSAIAAKDALKVNRIAKFFEQNQKNNPMPLTLTVLFNFFANLMICHYQNDKSPENLKKTLGFFWDIQIKDYNIALRNYNAFATMKCVSMIRECDAKSKGFGNSMASPGELLIELVNKMIYT